jgi:hypothetical protein
VTNEPVVLEEDEWLSAAAAHRARVRAWTGPHRERQERGEVHPVLDFLFTYYSFRPAQLERWHPGPGVVLRGRAAAAYLDTAGYVWDEATGGVLLDLAALPARLTTTAGFVRSLLLATAGRRPRLGCFGLHEWAMVYRSDQPRHRDVPLRLDGAGTDAVVEALPLQCTHHDAYRFFTAAARPRNDAVPTRETQIAMEQPGCLHANMDLYKWATKLAPLTPSSIVADCFALAVAVRELDMAASPYDLRAYGYEPVAIETPAGRAAYSRVQAGFVDRAAPLRSRLIDVCDEMLGESTHPVSPPRAFHRA